MSIDKTKYYILLFSNVIIALLLAINLSNKNNNMSVESVEPEPPIIETIETEPIETETETETETENEIEIEDKNEIENEIEQETEPEPTETTQENENYDYIKDNQYNKGYDYIEDDCYLYVTASALNVRSGPGMEYDILGVLLTNEQVNRIGIYGEWSVITYNGNKAFVHSNYLSYEMKETETVENKTQSNSSVIDEINTRGSMGRLYIPSVGVNVAIYGDYSQATVDREDSAAYLYGETKYGQEIIADHVHQGFAAMKKSVPGSTTLYIDFGTYQKHYICVDNFIGYNTVTDLTYLNGTSITGHNNGGLCLYTCNSDGTITITFWQPT